MKKLSIPREKQLSGNFEEVLRNEQNVRKERLLRVLPQKTSRIENYFGENCLLSSPPCMQKSLACSLICCLFKAVH